MSEIDRLRESLRKVQQERDRYRSETAHLRTENAKLQNDIDVLFTRLSDLDDRVTEPRVNSAPGATSDSTRALDHGGKHQHGIAVSAPGVASGRVQSARSSSSTREIASKVEEIEDNKIKLSNDDEGGTDWRKELKSLKRPRLMKEDSRAVKRNRVSSKEAVKVGSHTTIDNVPPMNVDDCVRSTSGTSASRSNEPTAPRFEQCAIMVSAGPQTKGWGSTPIPIMGPTSRTPSMHGNQAVTGPSIDHYDCQRYHTIPDHCLTLPPEKIQSYLKNAVCVPFQPPEGPINVSRYFVSESAYQNRGGVGKIRLSLSSTNTISKHVLIGSHLPYFPKSFGSRGLFVSCLKALLDNSHLWSCMALAPARSMVYLGEYRLMPVGTMSVEEYRNQKREAKIKTAGIMFSSQKDKQKGKVSSRDAVTEMAEAFAVGKEKVNILAMEFVHYDTHFAHTLRDAFKLWSEEKAHSYGGESAEKDKRKDRSTSRRPGVKRQRKGAEAEGVNSQSSEDQSNDDDQSDSEVEK